MSPTTTSFSRPVRLTRLRGRTRSEARSLFILRFQGLEGEADANQDGKITAGELHAYVRESVGRFSAGAQTPTMLGDAGKWVLR